MDVGGEAKRAEAIFRWYHGMSANRKHLQTVKLYRSGHLAVCHQTPVSDSIQENIKMHISCTHVYRGLVVGDTHRCTSAHTHTHTVTHTHTHTHTQRHTHTHRITHTDTHTHSHTHTHSGTPTHTNTYTLSVCYL